MSILFISNSNFGFGLSGGDRIFLELLRRWQKKQNVSLMGAVETKNLLQKYRLNNVNFYPTCPVNHKPNPTSFNVIFLQLKRTFLSCFYVISHLSTLKKYQTIYSVSDFYADLFPAFLLKLLSPSSTWIAGYYLFAPNPSDASSPYRTNHQQFKGFIYFFAQKFTLNIVKTFADIVFVTSQPDVAKFQNHRLTPDKIIVIRGGVDTNPSTKFLKKHPLLPPDKRLYSACFIGRLHPQKGVMELVDIWNNVVKKLPQAKLAIIGNGQLESEIRHKILKYKLNKNIVLFGFMEGKEKYEIFRQSAVIVHPATYDSGGMASAEAMSWGLPGVSFDLEALKTYYPSGMIKIPCYAINKFAHAIIKLNTDASYYQKLSFQARSLVLENWDWNRQADIIYQQVFPYEKNNS